MNDEIVNGKPADWQIDWASGRTRLRLVLFAVCTALTTVVGSLLGLFPEAFLYNVLTERGIASADGLAVRFAGGFVQLVCVVIALHCLARLVRWITSEHSAIDAVNVLDMHESMRRISRDVFFFPLFGAIALASQIIIELTEDYVMQRIDWADDSLMDLSRIPSAMFLIFVASSLTTELRRLLATGD